jgi:hypothetical protein
MRNTTATLVTRIRRFVAPVGWANHDLRYLLRIAARVFTVAPTPERVLDG